MDNKTTDRRIKKTRNALKKGLAELMLKKSLNDISVKELTDKVDLNRGTFYLHYKDIFDLVEKIEEEMFIEFSTVLKTYPPEVLNGRPLPLLKDIFIFLKDNASMCAVLLSNNGDIAFANKLKTLIKERCFNDWAVIFNAKKTTEFNYFYNYLLSGCIGIFQSWFENGLKESPEDIAKISEQMILHGVEILK